jgi:phosphatidylinositol-4-phosphate 3-kinase
MGFPAQPEELGLNTTTVSVLDIFDPLAESGEEVEEEEIYWSSRRSMSSFSESFYDTHDPFSYMEQQAELATRLGEVEEGEDEDDCPAPVVPRRLVGVVRPTSFAAEDTVLRRQRTARDYENIVKKDKLVLEKVGVVRKPRVALDEDVLSFVSMVREVRRAFPASDRATNPGFVAAARLEAAYPPDTQVKLVIGKVVFTANVETELEQVVAAVLAQGDSRGEPGEHWLQVAGQAEYLTDGRLADYEYVHLCYKYTRDVRLALVRRDAVPRCVARTEADDVRDFEVGFADISPLDAVKTLSYSELEILLATLQREAERMSSTGHTLATCSDREVMAALRPRQVLQAVKAVSALLGGVESIDLKEARERLTMVCLQFDQAKGNADPAGRLRPEIVEEVGERLAMVTLSKAGGDFRAQAAALDTVLQQLKSRVEALVRTYARTFRVDFQLEAERVEGEAPGKARLTTAVRETLLVRVCCVHRLPAGWSHTDYRVDLRVYHGTRLVGETLATAARPGARDPNSLHAVVWLDHWLEATGLPISCVPLEARLVVSLVGRTLVPGERGEPDSYRAEELGWAALQLFGQDRALAQGAFLLPVWPVEAVQQVGPAPDSGSHPGGATCPLVSLELPALGGPVTFPGEQEVARATPAGPAEELRPLHQLDTNSRQQLLDICEQDILEFTKRSPAERELVWDRRHYLGGVAGALPKVLLAAQAWDPASLPSLHRLLAAWPRPATPDILQLLLPTFPDSRVRAAAVGWLAELPTHQLIDFLPQLVEAVKHETWCVPGRPAVLTVT